MIIHYQLSLSIVNISRCDNLFCKVCTTFFIFIAIVIIFIKKFKLNGKTQPTGTLLIINPHSHIHPYIIMHTISIKHNHTYII